MFWLTVQAAGRGRPARLGGAAPRYEDFPEVVSQTQASVEMSLDTARTSDVVEKVCVHRSSKKASAISGPTRDRKDAVDHFISPKRAQENCSGTFSTTSRVRALRLRSRICG